MKDNGLLIITISSPTAGRTSATHLDLYVVRYRNAVKEANAITMRNCGAAISPLAIRYTIIIHELSEAGVESGRHLYRTDAYCRTARSGHLRASEDEGKQKNNDSCRQVEALLRCHPDLMIDSPGKSILMATQTDT